MARPRDLGLATHPELGGLGCAAGRFIGGGAVPAWQTVKRAGTLATAMSSDRDHKHGHAHSFALLASLALLGPACGGDEVPGADETGTDSAGDEVGESAGGACEPGQSQSCTCPNESEGLQTCTADFEWGACEDCTPSECGNGVCEPDELCDECLEDCGLCLDCAEAPSCEQAAIPGVIDTHMEALDVPVEGEMGLGPEQLKVQLGAKIEAGDPGVRMVAAALDGQALAGEHPFVPALRRVFAAHPEQAEIVRRQLGLAGMEAPADYRARLPDPRLAAGADAISPAPQAAPGDCEEPKLRIRVAKVIVHNEADLVFKDVIYCAIVSEAMPGAEIRVTPKTFALDNGEEYTYALAEGMVWGQLGEPVAPEGNLSMTYNCLEGDDTGAFEEFLDAIADAAAEAGGLPIPNGWVIGVVGLAAEIIGAALALENDDHLFNATQIIPADLQLDMTPGVWWSVERAGTFMLKDWHWELRMEAWGCTEDGTLDN